MLLDVESAKRIYNWFFIAYSSPTMSYKDNPFCGKEDIQLMKELETFLISQGE